MTPLTHLSVMRYQQEVSRTFHPGFIKYIKKSYSFDLLRNGGRDEKKESRNISINKLMSKDLLIPCSVSNKNSLTMNDDRLFVYELHSIL